MKPKVITLCGSSRFPDAFSLATMHLSMQGHIVIGLSCFGHADQPTGARFLTQDASDESPTKKLVDDLHFQKIDISDAIYVVNPGGYVGESTQREVEYAQRLGKDIQWMFPSEPLESASKSVIHLLLGADISPRLRNRIEENRPFFEFTTLAMFAADEVRFEQKMLWMEKVGRRAVEEAVAILRGHVKKQATILDRRIMRRAPRRRAT